MANKFDVYDRVRNTETDSIGYICWLKPEGLMKIHLVTGGYEECTADELKHEPDPKPKDRSVEPAVVCPYCGYRCQDSWELSADRDQTSCGRCGKEFYYARYVEYSYNTSVDEERV